MTVAIPSGFTRVGRLMLPCTVDVLFFLKVTLIHLECYSFLEVVSCISDAAQLSVELTESDDELLFTYQSRIYI